MRISSGSPARRAPGKSTLVAALVREARGVRPVRWRWSPSTRRRRSPAARCWAIGSGCRRWPAIATCSSARWPRAVTPAVSPRRRVAAATVLDAAGFELIFLETVGTGQSEVEVAAAADTTVVLEAPEMGDEVQAIKAGLLEVADIVVVNKGDRPGAQRTASQLRAMLVASAPRHLSGGPAAAETAGGAHHDRVDRCRRAGAARRARPARAHRERAPSRPTPRGWPGRPPRSGRSWPTGCSRGWMAPSRRTATDAVLRDVAEHRLDPYAAADELLAATAGGGAPMAVERVFVAGAGLMGHGIAQVHAAIGKHVTLYEPDLARAEAGKERIADNLARSVAKGRLTEADRDGDARANRADGLARRGRRRRPRRSRPSSRTSTSSRPCGATSTRARRPRRCSPRTRRRSRSTGWPRPSRALVRRQFVGMHFFSPVPVMPLIELIRGAATSDATEAAVRALADELGKQVIVSADRPGLHRQPDPDAAPRRGDARLRGGPRDGRGHRHGRARRPQPPDGPARAGRLHRPRRLPRRACGCCTKASAASSSGRRRSSRSSWPRATSARRPAAASTPTRALSDRAQLEPPAAVRIQRCRGTVAVDHL